MDCNDDEIITIKINGKDTRGIISYLQSTDGRLAAILFNTGSIGSPFSWSYNFDSFFDIGNRCCDAMDFANAIYFYTKALEFEPDNYCALYNRGRTYFDFKKYTEAILDLEKTLRMEKDEQIIDLINEAKRRIIQYAK